MIAVLAYMNMIPIFASIFSWMYFFSKKKIHFPRFMFINNKNDEETIKIRKCGKKNTVYSYFMGFIFGFAFMEANELQIGREVFGLPLLIILIIVYFFILYFTRSLPKESGNFKLVRNSNKYTEKYLKILYYWTAISVLAIILYCFFLRFKFGL